MVLPRDRLGVWINPFGTPADPNPAPGFPDGGWVDIIEYVRYRQGVTITFGRPDEATRVDSSTLTLSLDNSDGRFSPRNPLGPYYPNLGMNTPIILTWDTDGLGTLVSLYDGFVTEWPPRWDLSGVDAVVPIEASGVLRRLRQGQPQLKSPIYRDVMTGSGPVVYWTCQDPAGGLRLSSAISGGSDMIITGTPNLGAFDEYVASEPLPTMNGARYVGPVGDYEFTNQNLMRVFFNFPAGGSPDGTQLLGFPTTGSASSTPAPVRWAIFYETGGVLRVRSTDEDDVLVIDQAQDFDVDGNQVMLTFTIDRPLGGPIAWELTVVKIFADGTTSTQQMSNTLNRPTPGKVVNVVVNFNRLGEEIAFGHVVFSNDLTFFASSAAALVAHIGESAGDRILRLGDEENIFVEVIGVQAGETPMGPQRVASFLDLIRECEATDGGVLYESPDEFGLTYRNRGDLYNQAVDMTLSVPDGHLSEAPEPVDDDQLIVNDMTVERQFGASARVSDHDHVVKFGRYESSSELNLAAAVSAADYASWLVHLGTVDEMRWPRISFDPTRHPELLDPWLALRAQLASRVVVDHEITQLPGIDVDVLMQGWTERIDGHTWAIDMNCSPASSWDVATVGDTTFGRADTAGSELTPDLTAIQDTFERTVVDGWGTADTGQSWSLQGSPASAYSVNGGVGKHTYGLDNNNLLTNLDGTNGGSGLDTEVLVDIAMDHGADLTSSITAAIRSHRPTSSDCYTFRLVFGTGSGRAVSVGIGRIVDGGVATTLVADTAVTGLTHVANVFIRVRVQIIGTTLRMRAWTVGTAEPDVWHASTTDSTHTDTAGRISLQSVSNQDNFIISFDNLQVGFGRQVVDQPPVELDNHNPDFETSATDGWTSSGGASLEHSTVQAHTGTGSAKVTPNGSATSVTVNMGAPVSPPAIPGNSYLGEAWVFVDNLSVGIDQGLRVSLLWRDATDTVFAIEAGNLVDAPLETWTKLSVIGVAPANTATVGLRIQAIEDAGLGTDDIFYIDDAVLTALDTISVTTTMGPVWTTDDTEYPFDITVGGEAMTVLDIAGTGSPQTFTVIRAVNGVGKPHNAESDVRLRHPAIAAL